MNARGEPEAALEPLQRAVAELSDGLGPDHHSVSDPLSHLADALLNLGRSSEALEPSLRALTLRLGHDPANSVAVETARINLSRAQSGTGASAEALATLREALDAIASDTGVERRQAGLWAQMAEIHARTGDHAAASNARDRSKALLAHVKP